MLRIDDLAARSGVSVRSLRCYEEQGLLHPERTPGGQRSYAVSAVDRVGLIQQLFAAAIPSRVIVDLLPCVDTGRATVGMLQQMEQELHGITTRLQELQQAREKLEDVIDQVRRAGVETDEVGAAARGHRGAAQREATGTAAALTAHRVRDRRTPSDRRRAFP